MKIVFIIASLLISIQSFAQRGNPRYIKENLDQEENSRTYTQNHLRIVAPKVPSTYSLFGERIPLELWDVRERFDRELLINTYMQGSTCYIIKQMSRWLPMIEKALANNGIPDDFKYLCIAESALQNQTSRVGATGFWQFMKGTAPSYGLYIDSEVDERYDVEKSTEAACKYLRQAYNKFGNWTSAAASYNCGMGGMNSALNSQGESSFYNVLLPEETMRYIFRIAALKYILEHQKELGFSLTDDDTYFPLKLRKETINGSLGSLVSYAKSKGTNYKTIKMLNPWMRDKSLMNAKGRSYTILLPTN
ncbi:MAG: lytic transglycosylase domain-containing protein [Chitinophagaceae bacterium]